MPAMVISAEMEVNGLEKRGLGMVAANGVELIDLTIGALDLYRIENCTPW